MAAYDLYGCKLSVLTDAKRSLESLLGVQFERRNSSYQGGEYYRHGAEAAEHFILKKNIDPYDDEPAEAKFPDYPILFYVNASERPAQLRDGIERLGEGFILLRHDDF